MRIHENSPAAANSINIYRIFICSCREDFVCAYFFDNRQDNAIIIDTESII